MRKTFLASFLIMVLGVIPATGQNIIVWDFLTRDGESTTLTDNFSRAFEAALVEHSTYTVIERSPELKAMIDRERDVREIFDISSASLNALKVKGAEIAVFGDVFDDVESDEFHITVTFQSFEGEKLLIKSKLMPRGRVTDNLRRQAAMEELVKGISSKTESTPTNNSGGSKQIFRVIASDFIFDLEKCSLTNRTATCDFVITNNGEDRSLLIALNSNALARLANQKPYTVKGKSELHDEFNNAVIAERIKLANIVQEKHSYVKADLISGRPAEATMTFAGLSSSATVIARLVLWCHDGETGTQFTATFRNIPLVR